MKQKVIILSPVYNDELSVKQLIANLGQCLPLHDNMEYSVLLVDDASAKPFILEANNFCDIHILRLKRNLGHQKALAIGLAYIYENLSCDKILIMDSDGEDRPEDATKLLQSSHTEPGKVVFGHRKTRQESIVFRLFYRIYKLLFGILTGKRISFGNFLLMPNEILEKIVFYSEIWSHIPGGILKSKLPYTKIETHRGKRYSGESKMNFTSLVLHGLGAIAVFIEVIATRLLLFSLFMILMSGMAILIIIWLRTFTSLSIPGWASTVTSTLLVILLQSFLLTLFTIFLFLSSQSQRKFIPAYHYKDYTGDLITIQHE